MAKFLEGWGSYPVKRARVQLEPGEAKDDAIRAACEALRERPPTADDPGSTFGQRVTEPDSHGVVTVVLMLD